MQEYFTNKNLLFMKEYFSKNEPQNETESEEEKKDFILED